MILIFLLVGKHTQLSCIQDSSESIPCHIDFFKRLVELKMTRETHVHKYSCVRVVSRNMQTYRI
jgi:hypothetical protein